MSYAMFIDDERFPSDVYWMGRDFQNIADWEICRTFNEVIAHVETWGMPFLISFDHDLGENQPTGYDIAKALVELDMDGHNTFPRNFEYMAHSQNPVGVKNILYYLDNYMRVRR